MYQKGLLTYALDSQNNLVYVDNVAKGLACECYCPACKEKLVAKNGGTRRIHHFAHASGVECDGAYETMLHQLAKIKVQEAFLNRSEFNIQFKHESYCSNSETCRFAKKIDDCCTYSVKICNLKDFYDSCEQEVKYDSINRRSDLKLYSSIHPNWSPIYIEFYVTHASDDFKLHNGGKIIEVKIESESDIDKIIERGFIESTDRYFTDNIYTEFYNFKKVDSKNDKISHRVEFSRYILYPSGKYKCYLDVSSCRNLGNLVKVQKQSLLEACFLDCRDPRFVPVTYSTGMYYIYRKFGKKDCSICKYYVDECKLCWFKDRDLGINIRRPLFEAVDTKECPDFILNTYDYCLHPGENTILLE